jgi:ribonucleoside-diphosphate reductase alpha chain
MNVAPLTDNARQALEARYLRRDRQGRLVESPEQLFHRVASAVADGELQVEGPREKARWEDAFVGVMSSLDFLPNSPTLMNAGSPSSQLSACFVLPVEDAMESIFDAVKLMALIQRTGGGTGFSFSRLREHGALVASTGGRASGPVPFMKIFDCATENIKLGGKRRGANMGVLRVDHPDIFAFIEAKHDEGVLRNFNLSVGVTDAFMEALRRGGRYDLIDPQTQRAAGRLDATEVFDAIVAAAWHGGDPGLLFLDTINRASPTPRLGRIEATNPCGEVPLLPYESCNLGSVNLAHMLVERDGNVKIDWRRLAQTVAIAVRFLDDVIAVSHYPAPEIDRMARGNRKIGLGVMGLAEMFIRLGVPYDAPMAARIARAVMRYVARASRSASRQLAEERGNFLFWTDSVYAARGTPRRNATLNAIAPTGTLSIIAGTTSGIEPLFALAYRRTGILDDQTMEELTPLLEQYCSRHRLDVKHIRHALACAVHLADVSGIPPEMSHLFVTALEIAPRRHLDVQAAFQRSTDNSVSKTINLPASATPSEVAEIYRSAWRLGLKGVTVFRYGSRRKQVLELGVGERGFQYDHSARCDPTECQLCDSPVRIMAGAVDAAPSFVSLRQLHPIARGMP